MKISYNWLKWYIPDLPAVLSAQLMQAGAPEAQKLAGIFTYHVAEVESFEKHSDDTIFDIKILPNRAHDLLSHQGIAREVASLLNINFADPTSKYKVPPSTGSGQAKLEIKVESEKCRRYMGRIVRNIKVGPSPEWVVKHLESIGQRSINNIVDAANIVMFDCGQPIHCFDLDKLNGAIIVREAKDGEEMITLDNKQVKLKSSNLVIADEKNILAIAGVKGGKVAEVYANTKNIVIEVANFDSTSVRKTARGINIFTDAAKRFENNLSPELCDYAMLEMSALIAEYGATEFEEVVDVYPHKQEARKFAFSVDRISKILGVKVTEKEIEDIFKRYNFEYKNTEGKFVLKVPPMRLDLVIEEDIAEEIGRVLGYDKLKPIIPRINFKPKVNETYEKIIWARNKLLNSGYSEVMTYAFSNKGEVEVLESASDKKFLRTNLSDGLSESLRLNKINAPLLGLNEVKIFEVGTVFGKNGEKISVAYNEKDKIVEKNLEEFYKASPDTFSRVLGKNPQTSSKKHAGSAFVMWSLYPFISRDISVWVPNQENSSDLKKLIIKNGANLLIREPYLVDSFTGQDGRISYSFRLVFQSYNRTLTDAEINEIMMKITNKIKENNGWQVR